MHSWGDSWPYWPDLYKAQEYFVSLYERVTNKRPCTKEKWGSIRYENTIGWITNKEEARIFRECVRRTVRKFPQVACEIVCDAGCVLEDDYFEGWCAGIYYATKKAPGWVSYSRPNGV